MRQKNRRSGGVRFGFFSIIIAERRWKCKSVFGDWAERLTFSRRYGILCRQAGLPRVMAPQGIGMRKVRASQGGITDNVRRGRPPGKCNRNRLPTHGASAPRTVQMERRGKSSPARQATVCKCKPYPMQRLHTGTAGKPASCRPGRTAEAAERRLATVVTDRWQLRGFSSRTEPGLQACRKIPLHCESGSFAFLAEGTWRV